MAIHLLECAAHTDLPAAKKLALMAMADDADKESRLAAAGLDAVMAWSGLKRARALGVIAELVDEGFLRREEGGRIGRRARFTVMPSGCCPLHGPVPRGSNVVDPQDDSGGSSQSDPSGSNGLDPKAEVEGPIEGPIEGPTATGPVSYVPMSLPPNPRKAGGCNPAHPTHDNCRGCGSTRRQQAERDRRAKPTRRECRQHRGQLADHCGPCRSEQIADKEAS